MLWITSQLHFDSPYPRDLIVVPNSAIANQESLSVLETEMRKLEGVVKEIVDELGYLKTREERFTDTNSAFALRGCPWLPNSKLISLASTNQRVQNFAWFSIVSLTGLVDAKIGRAHV